eukprot:gene32417-16522_t
MEINVIGEMEAKSKLRFEEGRYAEAVRLYTIMSVLEPNNPEHHCQRNCRQFVVLHQDADGCAGVS